jgi:hypothetical protein
VSDTLFLHIGVPKTGTSSIQETFFRNIETLKQHGISYFPYMANHSAPMAWLFSHTRDQQYGTLKKRLSSSELESLRKEVSEALKSFLRDTRFQSKIISAEGVTSFTKEEVESLRKYIDAATYCQTKVIAYVRNYYELLASQVQERVRNGAVLHEIEAEILAGGGFPICGPRIRKFQQAFGRENVIIRVLDRRLSREGDVIADFCDTIGAPEVFDALSKVRVNMSISAESVRLISKYNELFPVVLNNAYNQARSEKVTEYFASTEGTKFHVTDPDVLAAYDRLVDRDRAFIEQNLPKELAALVLERREFAVGVDAGDAALLDIDRLYKILGRVLQDVESCEKGLQIALSGLMGEVNDVDALVFVNERLKFISDYHVCGALTLAFVKAHKPKCAAALIQRALELGADDPAYCELGSHIRNVLAREANNAT